MSPVREEAFASEIKKAETRTRRIEWGCSSLKERKAVTLLLAWLSASLRSSRSTYIAPVSVHGVYAGHVIGLCGSPLWRANDWAGEKFANGFANEPRSTAWHGASLARIVTRKMANKSTR